MAMSRKHYREVAEIIKAEMVDPTVSRTEWAMATRIAAELASMFKRDNGNFDRDKFMEACGL